MKSVQFETERLIITPTTISDDDLMLGVLNAPKFLLFVGDRNVRTANDARQYIIEKVRPQIEEKGYGTFTLRLKKTGQKIGICGLFDRPGVEGIDLGFGLLPEFEGFGYGFEASTKVINLAFNEFSLSELKAITAKENTGSQKLLLKTGFKQIGTLQLPEEQTELLLYSLSK